MAAFSAMIRCMHVRCVCVFVCACRCFFVDIQIIYVRTRTFVCFVYIVCTYKMRTFPIFDFVVLVLVVLGKYWWCVVFKKRTTAI